MAVNNRDEAIAQVDAVIVSSPKVSNTSHRNLLNDQILNSIIFRKDVILTETPSGGAVTVDYGNKDLAIFIISADVAVSFTNLANGDVKYLAITKNAGNTVAFVGALDVSVRKDFITSTITFVIYRVLNKDGNILVTSANVDNDVNIKGLTGGISKVLAVYTGWNMDTIAIFNVTYPSGVNASNFVSAEVTIKSNSDNNKYPLCMGFASFTASGLGGGYKTGTSGLDLYRGDAGEFFDDPIFNNADVQVFFKYEA